MIMCSITLPCALLVSSCSVAAPVNSGPLWQKMHPPGPRNTNIPRCAASERANRLPGPLELGMNWSKGLLSETRVDSYIWIARPQKREKFFSICVYPFQVAVDDQYFGRNAFMISAW